MSRTISTDEKVQVVVRCRPMSHTETRNNHHSVIHVDSSAGSITIVNPNPKLDKNEAVKQFTYDAVFDRNSTQDDIYETVRPLVTSVLSGFNGTIFAYGQTGTGKTYTMEGCLGDSRKKGIITRSFDQIFNHIGRSANQQFLVRTSYLEIYQEEIRDLLLSNETSKCEIREGPDSGVYIQDLSSIVCKNVEEIAYLMSLGNKSRSTGETNMNERSSRSHAILTVTIEMVDLEICAVDKKCIRVGKLNLVDLAGSERQDKSGAKGIRLKEAAKINLSLSALGNVISALVDGKTSHIPYRDSKLTRLLQDSLGGNSKTIMVANIGPASYNYEESLTTLRYANRAKNIKNKPKVNEDPKDALLRQYREEIARLKIQLKEKHLRDGVDGGTVKGPNVIEGKSDTNKCSCSDKCLAEELEKKIAHLESSVLCGGKNIIDHTNEQQRALELQNQEIAERKRMEVLIRQQLERQEDAAMEIQTSYSNLHQEVDFKTKKLKKVFAKFQGVKQEMHDVTEEFNRDRRELELTQNDLLKELKVRYMIIENFIPIEEKNKILHKVAYSDEQDEWILKKSLPEEEPVFTKRPVSTSERRPVSDYARVATHLDHHFRYQGENLISLGVDAPLRPTLDYEMPAIAPKIQAVLEQALMVEEDLNIDASQHNSERAKTVTSAHTSNAKSGSRRRVGTTTVSATPSVSRPDSGQVYPKARGLVPKK